MTADECLYRQTSSTFIDYRDARGNGMAAHQVLQNTLKDKLARGEIAASMFVRLVRSIEIAQLAKTAGFDSLYIDLEHSSFSLDATGQICMAALSVGITPLVRVPSLAPAYIARVLDGGALGVIVPHINSAADAERVVRAAKFPPVGDRAMTSALPQLRYQSYSPAEAASVVNDATMVVAMIETLEALENVEQIAAVPGIDLLLVGTNDLTALMDIPGQFDHNLVHKAYSRCIDACRRHGKTLGIGGLSSRPDLVAEFVRLGARFVSTGSDLSFLLGSAIEKVKFVRNLQTR
jgi:4-hydroxy-2-oxoheptanedioate aldolase